MDESVSSRGVEPIVATDQEASFVASAPPVLYDGRAAGDSNALNPLESTDEQAVLRRAATELAGRKSESRLLSVLESDSAKADSFETITRSLSDSSTAVRSAAVRALYRFNPELAASFLNKVIRESTSEQRQRIGAALIGSGLISNIPSASEDARVFYSAQSMLFLLAKIGEAEPLMEVIQSHPALELRLALIKTLGQSESPKVVPAFQKLLLDPSQPREIRSVVMEVLVQRVGSE